MESTRERSFCGRAPATYAELYFARDNLTLTLLEEDLSATIRNLITTTEAHDLLDQISEWHGKVKPQWKARADTHQAAIDGGDPFECAKVLKGLNSLEDKEPLRPRDKAHLVQSLELLTEELSHALNKRPSQTRKLINVAIAT